ncbi:MAG: flavoprotein [Candidatus Omnitrophota bacterium]|nr:flavoprotein [Candidatus Omnitrophota bacterium]
MKKRGPVILGVTGSIAAYKACDIISAFRKEGIDVQAVMTKDAQEFITPLSVRTLSRNKVITDMFALPEDWEPVHTSIADKAALILIAPATANVIGKLAGGICDDPLTCIVFATKAPVLIAPAMNEKMYEHKIVRANIAKLKAMGYKFVGPIKGYLACGHIAAGHIAETAEIVKEAKRLLK